MYDTLISEINKLKKDLENHELLKLAADSDDLVLEKIANIFAKTLKDLDDLEKELSSFEDKKISDIKDSLSADDLDEIASMASEMAWSDSPDLQKRAILLDNVLNIFGKDAYMAIKAADEKKENLYSNKEKKLSEIEKEIEPKVKKYRPLEAPMSTRYCPDHPGETLSRVGDGLFQCMLDKRQYDFKNGYTTLKGNKIPGGDVAEQTKMDSVISPMVENKYRKN